jgi:RNA 3'-terminal phosphate cyclase (ATP)
MISLDGSFCEGGGAIVRVALALSSITQKPFEATNIRKGRPNPGLKNQHLHCVKALEKLCDAETQGAFLGSLYLKYSPRAIESKDLYIDIGTSGSIALLLQSLLLPSMFAAKPLKIEITGGTEGKFAQPFDYFIEVFIPQIRRFANIEVKLARRGYYPKGNGKIELKISQKYRLADFECFEDFLASLRETIVPLHLTRYSGVAEIRGVSHASFSLQEAKVAERQAKAAELALKDRYKCPISIQIQYSRTSSPGSGITLWAILSNENGKDTENPIRLGADSLGERGKRAESVGQEAATNLIKEIESKAPVDRYLADQLLPFMALAGKSTIRTSKITNHCKTNIYVIEKFLGRTFKIEESRKTISTIN